MRDDHVVPDWYAICFDETKYWNVRPEDKRFIKGFIGVYMFDRNSKTYVAELTPSYALLHVYNDVIFKPKMYDGKHDRKRDELQEHYLYSGGAYSEDTYMHVSSVESFMKKHKKKVYHYGSVDDWEDEADRGESIVREYLQGNPPF